MWVGSGDWHGGGDKEIGTKVLLHSEFLNLGISFPIPTNILILNSMANL